MSYFPLSKSNCSFGMIVMQLRVAIGQYICVHHKYSKNTIRDGGNTGTDCFTLIKQYHVCQYKLLGKFKTLLEWADALPSKMLDGVEGWWTVVTGRAPTVLIINMNEYYSNSTKCSWSLGTIVVQLWAANESSAHRAFPRDLHLQQLLILRVYKMYILWTNF